MRKKKRILEGREGRSLAFPPVRTHRALLTQWAQDNIHSLSLLSSPRREDVRFLLLAMDIPVEIV